MDIPDNYLEIEQQYGEGYADAVDDIRRTLMNHAGDAVSDYIAHFDAQFGYHITRRGV